MSAQSLLLCIVVLVLTSSALGQLHRSISSGFDLQKLLLSSLIDTPDRPDRPDMPDRRDRPDSSDVRVYTLRANNPIIITRTPSRAVLSRGLVPNGLSSHGLSSRGLSSHGLSHGLSSHGLSSHGLLSHGLSSHGRPSSHGLSSHGLSSRSLMSSDIGSQFRTLKLLGEYCPSADTPRPGHPGLFKNNPKTIICGFPLDPTLE
ncbi:hypothetical protein KP79_PYT09665 [Mizuhopecten yessoensis]|uniref:Uncharacterized protein n=1 Tax=Mizuhopecten yessoensis TaxID=6573 RepID=A0A210PFG0_MIZYE|nr:hypothetical protein KP79_PYT09665 [Mizuhopecten yessoensis]